MTVELKQIISVAVKTYHLDMKVEQKIVDNIPFSEEWFLLTFERLKAVGGKALH
jgi:hypothetical protein